MTDRFQATMEYVAGNRARLPEIGQTDPADVKAHLPTDSAPLVTIARANHHLDHDLRALGLTPALFQAIAAA
ncbi:MAG: hypothetical protein GY778_28140 [bacterium]|nr:hypothetical protein [bacterium]